MVIVRGFRLFQLFLGVKFLFFFRIRVRVGVGVRVSVRGSVKVT